MLLRNRKRFDELMACLRDDDPCVAMRAADVAEKITRGRPDWLQPYKEQLLTLLADAAQIEVRWHLALMLPRLRLTLAERHGAAEILQMYLHDRSSIVKTCAMQGLADLARQDGSLKHLVLDILHSLTRTGTPAMRARGRILLKQLK